MFALNISVETPSKNGAEFARFQTDLGQLLAKIDRVFPQVFDQ